MWNAVELDMIPGRVRAVSAPEGQMLAVWATDGLYGIWFGRSATTLRLGGTADAEKAFDAARGVLTWRGVAFPMHGECGAPGKRYGGTLPASSPHGDSLAFDATGRAVAIDTSEGARVPIENPLGFLPGPAPGERPARPAGAGANKWHVAGFSADGRYLLVADEWDVKLFRYSPPKGGSPTREPRSLDEQALLGAISAEPDDDNARLVYADWLADNGRPERGEFIRLQCAHARALRAGKLFAGDEREQELLSAYGDLWQAEYPVIRGVKWSGFWRGFPGATVPIASTLTRNAKAIWDAAPVESVVIQKFDQKGASALAACPQLDRLRVLEFRSLHGGADTLRPFFACSALCGLWWLAAYPGHAHFTLDMMELLANSESLRNLEMLTLRWCGVTDDGARALAASPHLNKLRDVDLTGNEFTGDVPSVLRKRFPGVRF